MDCSPPGSSVFGMWCVAKHLLGGISNVQISQLKKKKSRELKKKKISVPFWSYQPWPGFSFRGLEKKVYNLRSDPPGSSLSSSATSWVLLGKPQKLSRLQCPRLRTDQNYLLPGCSAAEKRLLVNVLWKLHTVIVKRSDWPHWLPE